MEFEKRNGEKNLARVTIPLRISINVRLAAMSLRFTVGALEKKMWQSLI